MCPMDPRFDSWVEQDKYEKALERVEKRLDDNAHAWQERMYKILASAKRLLSSPDPTLAVFVLRNLDETRLAGLDNLAWVYTEMDGRCHRSEAASFVRLWEEWIDLSYAKRQPQPYVLQWSKV